MADSEEREFYERFGDFLHENPEAEDALRAWWRRAAMQALAEGCAANGSTSSSNLGRADEGVFGKRAAGAAPGIHTAESKEPRREHPRQGLM